MAGVPSTPTQGDWLAKTLPVGSKVGVDPRLVSKDQWMPLSKTLSTSGHSLIPVQPNMIDAIWEDRPEPPKQTIEPLGLEFAGKSWQDKVKDVIKKMSEKNSSLLLLTALDDIACKSKTIILDIKLLKVEFIRKDSCDNRWKTMKVRNYICKLNLIRSFLAGLLNLRGSDIMFNPVFFSWLVVTSTGEVHLFVDASKVTRLVRQHLNLETDVEMSGSADANNNVVAVLHPYEAIDSFLKAQVRK